VQQLATQASAGDMIRRKYRIATLIYAALESLVTLLSFLTAYLLRAQLPSSYFGQVFPFQSYVALLVVILVLWNILFALVRLRKQGLAQDWLEVTQEVSLTVFAGTVLISAAIFVLKYEFISRPFIAIFAIVNFLFLCIFRVYARAGVSQFTHNLDGERQALIVGTNDKAAKVAEALEEAHEWGYRLVGVVRAPNGATDAQTVDSRLRQYPFIELERLGEVLRNHVVDEVIFVVDKDALAHLEEIFLICEEEGIKTRVMLSFFPHVTSKIYLEALQDLPLLTFSTTPENDYLLFIKNIFDVLAAAFALFLLAPFMCLVALLVKLTSPGPVIFRQVRCGLGGRKFVLYKFRSMILEAEEVKDRLNHLNEMSGPVFKLSNDPRCTPIGKWLRKFSIDELPQLVNILKGDMSFVGPRPPIPEEVEQYERWQRRRLRMKPGLTCLWQAQGRNDIDFDEWMKLDLQYIDTWSLLLDFKICLRTIPIVLLGKGR
jgi:exopolysaccharide biosynthesis polyprenyl glycosylphosphotransferase